MSLESRYGYLNGSESLKCYQQIPNVKTIKNDLIKQISCTSKFIGVPTQNGAVGGITVIPVEQTGKNILTFR